MRRNDREIIDKQEILAIMKKAEVCRVAFSDNNEPYIVPLNFGFEPGNPLVLYFHCAPIGRKLEIIRRNNRACFEMETDTRIIPGKQACDWSMQYRSVIGNGLIEIVESEAERKQGLTMLMKHYAGETNVEFNMSLLKRTIILKLIVSEISGKEHRANK
jgi:nitroimidazol reductase NimA-like FMN-containing flavoprotein (pyridoxamine 5'-phosphate oxidase superfamily)